MSSISNTCQPPVFDQKVKKKVAFSAEISEKRESVNKKLKLIINNQSTIKSKNTIGSMNTFKSLNASFNRITYCPANTSKRTIKPVNPSLDSCQQVAIEIIGKLDVYEDSKFCQKQLMGWLTNFF